MGRKERVGSKRSRKDERMGGDSRGHRDAIERALTLVETQVATAILRAQNADARSAPEREKLQKRVLANKVDKREEAEQKFSGR